MSTGVSAMAVPSDRSGLALRVRDYLELAKPKITVLELFTVAAAMSLAGPGVVTPGLVVATLLGTLLVGASANAINQYLERRLDALMTRTADRPLPAGRMAPHEAAVFGVATLAFGTTLLAVGANLTTALVGLTSWLLYVGVYTPMKTRSTLNTTVGAVAGALPIVMGWTAIGGGLDATAAGLFGVLFFWQFPHFMAIAWLCREDYARAGYRMTAVVEPTGLRAGAHAVACAALLLPVAMTPFLALPVGMATTYAALTLAVGLWQLVVAVRFMADRTDRTARRLLRASLVYLPCWLLLLTLYGG